MRSIGLPGESTMIEEMMKEKKLDSYDIIKKKLTEEEIPSKYV